MTVMQAHANTRYGVQAVRNKGTVLGRAASLSLQDRLALGALNGRHEATRGGRSAEHLVAIADLLDELGYPKEGV